MPDPVMRTSPHRRSIVAAALLAATCGLAPATAQRIPQRRVSTPIEFATGAADNLFSLSRSEENIHEWETAIAELAAGEMKAAVDRLHKLLQSETGGVVPVSPGRFLGLRLAVITTMANMPPAAVEAYEALVAREASNLIARPLHELDLEQLERLAHRFPTSSLGRRARLRLGDLALTAGRGRDAAEHFRLALDAAAIGSSDERRAAERLECAGVLAHPVTARANAASRTLSTAGSDVLAVLPAANDPGDYPAVGGGDGRLPMSEPAGRPRSVMNEDVAAPGFEFTEGGRYSMFAVGDLDGIYVNVGTDLLAIDPLRGGVAWMSDTPPPTIERGEQVNKDMVLAPAASPDVVVAALQVPDPSFNVDFQGAYRIISRIPQRRLFGYSRSGTKLWSHFDDIGGARTKRFRGHDACGPPIVVGDTVYAPIHDRTGAIAFSIGAYDVATGQPKWRQLICSSQQDVNMFGNARMEFAASPLSVSDGVIYGSSNLGVAFAIESRTGNVRWITSYEVIKMPLTRLQGQAERPVYFANNAPIVTDGVVCMTPLDSQFALGIDAETGLLLWRLAADATVGPVQNRVRWLAGAFDDEFVLSGRGAIAVKARLAGIDNGPPTVRQLVRPDALRGRGEDDFTPRPAVTADHVWFAGAGRIVGFDRTGEPLAPDQRIELADYQPGNLLFVDGAIVSLRQHRLDVLMDTEALQRRIAARLESAPDDPAALLRLANLRRALLPDDPDPAARKKLVELYQRGIAAAKTRGLPNAHPTLRSLQRALFAQVYADATAAMQRNDSRTLDLLMTARAAAYESSAFVMVQSAILDRCGDDPERRRRELDLLEQQAPDGTMPGNNLPVRVFVAWQRALLPNQAPAAAVAAWQTLLENHGDVALPTGLAAKVAEAAINRLIAQHGPAAYATIAARADRALAAAGDDDASLQDVATRYPASEAAKVAQLRLLDRAVKNGDLARACRVLAQKLGAEIPAGIARRVLIAATLRGNRGLAAAMATSLARHRDEVSDWPDDRGAKYGAVLAAEPTPPPPAQPVDLELPLQEIARVQVRAPGREGMHVLSVTIADGFAEPADRPLYATLSQQRNESDEQLVAIDLAANVTPKPYLFTRPVDQLTEVVACGPVLVVATWEHLVGIDHRSGETIWELPNPTGLFYDSLGVQSGVLHLCALSQSAQSIGGELLGVEPLTGAVLFRRVIEGDRPTPKPVPNHLLLVETPKSGGASLAWLDPVSGEPVRHTAIADAKVVEWLRTQGQADAVAARNFPQRICSDGERVFLPLGATENGDEPRLVAIAADGKTAWQWSGRAGTRLQQMLREDRIVVVESNDQGPGRAVVLSAIDGTTISEAVLGPDPKLLNWEIGWAHNPAPAILALSDRMDTTSRRRRFVGIGVGPGLPTFEVALSNDDLEVDRQPLFGRDFVTFGTRTTSRNTFRLWCVKLADRSGVFDSGRKWLRQDLPPPHGLGSFGAYTVVSSADRVVVFGQGK